MGKLKPQSHIVASGTDHGIIFVYQISQECVFSFSQLMEAFTPGKHLKWIELLEAANTQSSQAPTLATACVQPATPSWGRGGAATSPHARIMTLAQDTFQ
jgi:hypothetical protein